MAAYTFAGIGKESEILAVTTTLGKSVLRMRCTLANRPSFSLPYCRKLTLTEINSSSKDARKFLEVLIISWIMLKSCGETLFSELELMHVRASKIIYCLDWYTPN